MQPTKNAISGVAVSLLLHNRKNMQSSHRKCNIPCEMIPAHFGVRKKYFFGLEKQ
jgi:hypothetical protein